jgi:ElaB/YqjD/DUF883 family membrane-anchored ribosome-binding protein
MIDPNSSNEVSAHSHSDGPSTQEDMTIAEILEAVHAEAGANHPGKNGYRREKGKVEWIEQSAAKKFLAKHGAQHPSNYREKHGQEWEDDFFQSSGTPRIPTMNTDTTKKIASDAENAADTVTRKSKDACCAIRGEANEMLACAHDTIRRNPIPAVAGAFAFGLAVGCLIMSGRSSDTMEDRYIHEPLDHAADALSSTLNRLRANLKFW